MTNIEKRGGLLGVETRADGDKRTLAGYAAVFNSPADIGGAWVERITPGAFSGAIGGDVCAFVNHDSGRVIGRTKSGTLRMSEDNHGLRVEIDVPNTTDGNDLWALVERGDISGMSIGFMVTKQEWDETTEPPTRTISKVDLFEVSAVAFPAYKDTSIGKRSLEAAHLEAEAAKAEEERKKENDMAAKRRIAERRARQEQRIRGIQSPEGDGQDAA